MGMKKQKPKKTPTKIKKSQTPPPKPRKDHIFLVFLDFRQLNSDFLVHGLNKQLDDYLHLVFSVGLCSTELSLLWKDE